MRFPATTLLLAALLVGAVVTGTATRALTAPWLRLVGFAPRDLWELDLARLFTSAMVTHGPRVLLVALIMTALSVGLVERQAGWRVLDAMGIIPPLNALPHFSGAAYAVSGSGAEALELLIFRRG